MAFTATLELTAEPVHFPVLGFHWAVVQQSGERSEPMAGILAGQLHLVLATRVRALDVASADAMAFVVSGGVSGLVPAALSTGEYATVRSS